MRARTCNRHLHAVEAARAEGAESMRAKLSEFMVEVLSITRGPTSLVDKWTARDDHVRAARAARPPPRCRRASSAPRPPCPARRGTRRSHAPSRALSLARLPRALPRALCRALERALCRALRRALELSP